MQKKTKKNIKLVAAVSMALLGMSYGMMGQVEAYGTKENPESYDSYKEKESTITDKDIYVAKYSEGDGYLEGSAFNVGKMAVKGGDSTDASQAGTAMSWGVKAGQNGLSQATITIGDKEGATEITGGKDGRDDTSKNGAKGEDKGTSQTAPASTDTDGDGTVDPTTGGAGGDAVAGASGGDATGYGIVLGKGSDVTIHVVNNTLAKNEFIVTGGQGGDGGFGGNGGSGQSFGATTASTDSSEGGRGGVGGDGGAGGMGGKAEAYYIDVKNNTGLTIDLNYDDAKRDTQTDIVANGGEGGDGGNGGKGGAGGSGTPGGQGGDAGDGAKGGNGGEAIAAGMTFSGADGLVIHGDGFNVSATGGTGGDGGNGGFGGKGGAGSAAATDDTSGTSGKSSTAGGGGDGGDGGNGGKATATALAISNTKKVNIQIDTITANATGGKGGDIGTGGGNGDDLPSGSETQVVDSLADGDTSAPEESEKDEGRGKAGKNAGTGGNAVANAVSLDGATGQMTVESITATATAGAGGKDTQAQAQQIGKNGLLAQAQALGFKNTTLEILGDKDAGNGITIRAVAQKASGIEETDDSNGNTKTSGEDTNVIGNVALAIHQQGGAISYTANGKLAVSAEAVGDGLYPDGTTEKTAAYAKTESDAYATALELAGGKASIDADEVSLSATTKADRDGISMAYAVHINQGGNLYIDGTAGEDSTASGNITITAVSDAGDETNISKGVGRAIGITNVGDSSGTDAGDTSRDVITLVTDGKVTISAEQKNKNADKDNPPTGANAVMAANTGNDADETASVAYAVELAGADMTIDALDGIEISAANAAATDAGEFAIKAEDSTISLYGGKDEDAISLNGQVRLRNKSTMTLRSSGSINAAKVGTTTGQDSGNLEIADSTLILQEDAKTLSVANSMAMNNGTVFFFDAANPESTQDGYRKITVGNGGVFVVGENNELYVRTNSLAGDVGDCIETTGQVKKADGATGEAKVKINVLDEGMKTGYDGKDAVELNDGKGITIIKAAEGISDDVEIEYTADGVAYDNGVWSYEYDAEVKMDADKKNVVLSKVTKTKTSASSAQKTAADANTAAAASAISFFGADETLHERLGDLRAAKGEKENGIWAKYIGGRLSADGMSRDAKVKYNGVEIGYDHYIGNNWTVGLAGEYIDGDTTLTAGNGSVKTKAGALYGTWLGDKGHHLDIVAKVGKVDSEMHSFGGTIANKMDGDFDANAYSLSVEYGRKYDVNDDWFVTPAARLSYVHMGSASYDVKASSNTMHAKNDSFNSFLLRAGARAGKKFSDHGSFYFKLAALYDFDGDTATTITADGRSAKYENDLGGFGLEYGLGLDYAFGNSSLYFDLERISGGDLEKDWGVNVGFRYQF